MSVEVGSFPYSNVVFWLLHWFQWRLPCRHQQVTWGRGKCFEVCKLPRNFITSEEKIWRTSANILTQQAEVNLKHILFSMYKWRGVTDQYHTPAFLTPMHHKCGLIMTKSNRECDDARKSELAQICNFISVKEQLAIRSFTVRRNWNASPLKIDEMEDLLKDSRQTR